MTPKSVALRGATLAEFRKCAGERTVASCRLVHYAGAGSPNAIDVSLDAVEKEIVGCLAEGFKGGWYFTPERLYLYVQEPGCPTPSRERVIAEEALVNVDELLKKEGLSGV